MEKPKTLNTSQIDSEEDKPLSIKIMIFFGVGQTGGQLFRDSPAALLPLFMSTILAVAPWLAGLVVLIPKIWVIICDPLMGAYSDRLKPIKSRQPFLLVGGILTSISFIALFSFADFSSPIMAAIVVGIIFFIGSTAFSAFSVPYLAVASELSTDPHERTKALSFRMVFTVLGVVLGFGLAQPLVFKLGGDAAAWQTMAIIFGCICLVTMLATAIGLPRNYGKSLMKGDSQSISFLNGISKAVANKPFTILASTYFLQSIAQASGFAVVGFVFIYAIQDINLLLPFILIMSLGSILSQPFWLKLSKSIGKINSFWIACVCWLTITFTWLWVGPGEKIIFNLVFVGDLTDQKILVLLRGFIIGITNAGFILLSFSLFTDTVEYQKKKDSFVDEGLFSGLFSAVEKLAFALGPLITGTVLSITGFQASLGGAVEQSLQAIEGMVWCYSIVPAILMFLSLCVFSKYKKALN